MSSFLQRLFFLIFPLVSLNAQDAASIYKGLEKLNFLGSVLYVAAHPDDENTALITHFSNHRHAHTAYLSLTRGDGGQNLIGTELRELLGVIRTQELMQARAIDGGEQYFTSAVDFGYSKHPDETLSIWNKKELLGEVVGRIRAFQPDIIIHRFDHRSPGRTHGHHTSSAMLSHEAFRLASDPNSYPAQLQTLKPWQSRRQFFNTSWWFYGSRERFEKADKSNLLSLSIGNYDFLHGRSNSQIAALSRSSHKSQGFGSSPRLGERIEYIELIQGDQPTANDPFEGINTSWSRIAGGKKIGDMVKAALDNFNFKVPGESVAALLQIHRAIDALPASVWKDRKLVETKNLIKACTGLTLQLNAERAYGAVNETVEIRLESVHQYPKTIHIKNINNSPVSLPLHQNKAIQQTITYPLPSSLSTPYWLTQKGTLGRFTIADKKKVGAPITPPLTLPLSVTIDGIEIVFTEPINYRINDPVRGEVVTPFYVLPSVAVNFEKGVHLFPDAKEREIQLEVTANAPTFSGLVELCFPKGWEVDKVTQKVTLNERGSSAYVKYKIKPTPSAKSGLMVPLIHLEDRIMDKVYEVQSIDYTHIPKQYVAQPSQAKLVSLDLTLPKKKVGYIMGAGDLVLANLNAVGLEVEEIELETATQAILNQYDTIILGIRAFNVLESLQFKNKLLFDFAAQGGTLIVQYNTSRGLKTKTIAPYPIQLSRDRVTDENSSVRILNPQHQILNVPHKISTSDFQGWVQERGLYFASKWDPKFTPLLGMNDKGEEEKMGSLLIAKHGSGQVIYTGLSFFRELPAGVPGAYRLLMNLIAVD